MLFGLHSGHVCVCVYVKSQNFRDHMQKCWLLTSFKILEDVITPDLYPKSNKNPSWQLQFSLDQASYASAALSFFLLNRKKKMNLNADKAVANNKT